MTGADFFKALGQLRTRPAAQLGVVAAALLGLSAWFYYDIIGLGPSFNHTWAQADWFALALQFRARGYDFFHPATFNLLTDDGVTGAGFPLPAYLAALLMGACGTNSPALMRLVTLGFGLGGLLALFALVRGSSGSFGRGLAAVLFAVASPIYVFYQANFLPSVAAYGLALGGYYGLYRALAARPTDRAARRRWLAAAVAALAVAAAMRTPFAVPLLASLGQVVVFRRRWAGAALGWGWVASCYGLAFGFIGADFLYNEYLSRAYHGSMFLARPLPFRSVAEAWAMSGNVYRAWGTGLLSPPQWGGLAAVVAAALAQRGRWLMRWHWAGHWLLLAAGTLCYYGLMGRQFEVHDYYLIDTFLLPLVLLGAGSLALWQAPRAGLLRVAVGGAAVLVLGAALEAARTEQAARTALTATDGNEITRYNFADSAPWLASLGVPPTATVLVLDARSFNLPLLLAQRRGWTVLSTAGPLLQEALKLPADYIITQNFSYLTDVVCNYPLITERLRAVATNGRLSLWQLRPRSPRPYWQLATDLETMNPRQWQNQPTPGDGPALSGRRAAWLRGADTYGLSFHSRVDSLGIRGGDRLLLTARSRAEGNAQAQLVCSLEPAGGGPAYWYHTMPCPVTPPGAWWSVGGAFALAPPRTPADILKVYLMKTGPDAAALDDLEMALVR